MGKAHSNPLRATPYFFDLEIKPVMKVACGRTRGPREEFAARWGWEEVETDWRKAVRWPDVDIVDISLPPNLNHEVALEAAKAGKHIFCEKPLVMNYEQAREMFEAAEKNGVKHYLNHNYPRCPAVMLAKASGRRGENRADLPLARRVSAELDRRFQFPHHLAPPEGNRGLGPPGEHQLAQRRPRAVPRGRDQDSGGDDGPVRQGEASP